VDFLCLFGIRNRIPEALKPSITLFPGHGLTTLAVVCPKPEITPQIVDDICHARCVMDGTGAWFRFAR
jgi:hypothetical protein